jgi:hypothetical protein
MGRYAAGSCLKRHDREAEDMISNAEREETMTQDEFAKIISALIDLLGQGVCPMPRYRPSWRPQCGR